MTPFDLRAARETIGWTGRELARRLGCSPDYVGQIERGQRPIPAPIASWLRDLAAHHARYPAPAWRRASAERIAPEAPQTPVQAGM